MAGDTSERLGAGSLLHCGHCGTEVRLEHVGGGRMECCDTPLTGSTAAAHQQTAGADPGARARCTGCGNEVCIEQDGGGALECCNEAMVRA